MESASRGRGNNFFAAEFADERGLRQGSLRASGGVVKKVQRSFDAQTPRASG
jgi:hypothetical protein